jgi:hypothetical protein
MNEEVILTDELIRAAASHSGGYNAAQLKVLGIQWPPTSGWKKRLIGTTCTRDKYAKFLALGGVSVSAEIIPVDDQDAQIVPLSPATLAHVTAYPSLMVPLEVRPALLECWCAHRTMKGLEHSAFPIAVPLSIWINREGLRPDDAAAILRSMQGMTSYSKCEFSTQLLAEIAARCAAAVKRREAEAEAIAHRQAREIAIMASEQDREEIKRMLVDVSQSFASRL